MTSFLTSSDGTRIAFDRIGDGQPVVLVDGAFCTRAFGPNSKLAAALADTFTVYTYDRRGRGESTDTAPHSVEREIEDLAAVIEHAGGRACVYGISSGAGLSLQAAARLPSIEALAVFEAPFIVDETRVPLGPDFLPRVRAAVAAGQRGRVIDLFMREGVAQPAAFSVIMRLMPAWRRLKAIAHTVPYDLAALDAHQRGRPLDPRDWADVSVPTLVMHGGKSPVWLRNAMRQLAEVLPHAVHHELPGQTHMVKPAALAPELTRFFGAHAPRDIDVPPARVAAIGARTVT